MNKLLKIIKSAKIEDFKPKEGSEYFTLVSRKMVVLLRSLFAIGLAKKECFQDVLKFSHHYARYDSNSKVFIDRIEMEQEKKKILELQEKYPNYFKNIIAECEKRGEEILAFSYEIKKSDFKGSNKSNLFELFEKYCQMMVPFGVFVIAPLSMQSYLEEKIKTLLNNRKIEESELKRYSQAIATPSKENYSFVEQKELLKIIIESKNNLKYDLEKALKEHAFKFGCLGQKYGVGKPWEKKDFQERVAESKADAEERLQRLLKIKKQDEIEIKNVICKYNLDEQEQDLITTTRDFVYLRTYRADVLSCGFANINNLLREIAKYQNIPNELIFQALPEEIIENKIPPIEILSIRSKNSLCFGNNDQLYFCEGKVAEEAEKLLEKFEPKTKEIKQDEIKGIIANPGKVKGKVRLMFDNSDIYKVGRGDIIVAPMTTPDFMPAMEKAIAFVTDEGGILCHAAIVSREMNKPCIIGTKIATKVLKDGDLVEVDADKGVVKVIGRTK